MPLQETLCFIMARCMVTGQGFQFLGIYENPTAESQHMYNCIGKLMAIYVWRCLENKKEARF